MASGVQLSVDGRVATIRVERPETRNALDRAAMAGFATALDEVDGLIDRDEIAVVAVRGGGDRVFISGGDLKELAQIRAEADAQEMSRTMRTCLDRLAALPVPTVALLNGDAYGGGAEVAIACDMRVAAADVKIGFNQVALGIMPAWGGAERLTTVVGRGRAIYLLLTGRVLAAAEAAAAGVIEHVVARDDFDAEAATILAQLAAVPATPSRAIKALVGSVAPPSAPELAAVATAEFARSWIADEHWTAVKATEERRAARKALG